VDLGQPRLGHLAVDLELEPLPLAYVGHTGEPETRKGPVDGLALGIEDLRLRHDRDDYAGHEGSLRRGDRRSRV
jgi:hypothetical protein